MVGFVDWMDRYCINRCVLALFIINKWLKMQRHTQSVIVATATRRKFIIQSTKQNTNNNRVENQCWRCCYYYCCCFFYYYYFANLLRPSARSLAIACSFFCLFVPMFACSFIRFVSFRSVRLYSSTFDHTDSDITHCIQTHTLRISLSLYIYVVVSTHTQYK